MRPWLNWIEYQTTNLGVAGSTPAGRAIFLTFNAPLRHNKSFMRFFIKLIFLIFLLAGVLYLIYSLKTTGIRPEYLFLDSAAQKSFNTQDVTHFEWRTQSQIFSFDKTSSGQWQPEKNQNTLKKLLDFLSQIQLNNVQQTTPAALEVILKVQNETWRGSWDGLSFVWIDGPKKGMGEILSSKKNQVFFRGRFIFDNVAIDLCPTDPKEILLRMGSKNYTFLQKNGSWTNNGAALKIDSDAIKKWIRFLCNAPVRAIIDPAYNPSRQSSGAITIKYSDGKPLSLTRVESDLFLIDKWGVIFDGMTHELDTLQKALEETSKP